MKKKKWLKIAGGVLAFLLLLLLAVPFYLEAKIGPILRTHVNQAINGHFDFDDADLSLIRDFPNARITLRGVRLTTAAPFDGDTLLLASEGYLSMGLGELLKGGDGPMGIRELRITGADLRLKVNAGEQPNYLIARESDSGPDASGAAEGFRFDLQQYALEASRISYEDQGSGMTLVLEEIGHTGRGDLSLATSELDTHTEALISFRMDSVDYLSKNRLSLDALIGIDLGTDTYTFLKNEGTINQMPIVFTGAVKLLEDSQQVDLQFHTPDSDFRNFLALIPEAYSKNLEGVHTTGQFRLEGTVSGVNDDTRIPGFDIQMEAKEASFQYPNLPRRVENISFLARLRNETGQTADTYFELPEARFTVDRDAFSMQGSVRELTGNPRVEGAMKGTINLASLSQAYPADPGQELSGVLQVDLQTAFDMASVEAGRYENTRTSGTLLLTDALLHAASFSQPVKLERASLSFDPKTARLESLRGTLGSSDFDLSGRLEDYLGYFLSDGLLRGEVSLSANQLVVGDFQSPEAPASEGEAPVSEAFRIPANIDLAVQGRAATVMYDNLPLREVSGTLLVRDQSLLLQNVRSQMLDGALALNGELNTRSGKPEFRMDLGVDGFRIREALEAIDLFRTLAPIASILEGRLNSQVSLGGLLNNDFSPDLMSLGGRVVAEVLAARPSGQKAAVLQALDNGLDFVNLEELDLKGLKTYLSFENGKVAVKPFTVRYRDISVNIEGGHTFDQQLSYQATFEVPAHYLGPEVNRLLKEMNDPGLEQVTVPVSARISGSYTQPAVETDLPAAAQSLTARLVEYQKQKLLAGGQAKAEQLLGNLLGEAGDSTGAANAPAADLGKVVGDVLGATGQKAPKNADSTAAAKNESVKEAARNVLGGLLKKKKDTSATPKDSVK